MFHIGLAGLPSVAGRRNFIRFAVVCVTRVIFPFRLEIGIAIQLVQKFDPMRHVDSCVRRDFDCGF